MRVCFVASEIFAWGKYGGFGSMVRVLARGLVERGIEVCAIVPRRQGQDAVEKLDGFTVLGYRGWSVLSADVYERADADIYHSQEATLATLGAMKAMPDRRHIVTCIDPWDHRDWQVQFSYDIQDGVTRAMIFPLLWAYYSPRVVGRAVRNAHAVFSQSRFLIPKIQRVYRLADPPTFLPNPYDVPRHPVRKAKQPTVCYLARWDPRKRPEIFFELARQFPQVRFIALGKAHGRQRDKWLRQRYGSIHNLTLTGFINPFESHQLRQILEESWIMVNVAAREGLPVAFVEAAAHRCAILSAIDADGFASRGGYHVRASGSSSRPAELGGQSATVDDYVRGLEWLLEDSRWREKGEAGYHYVLEVHDRQAVVDKHLSIYHRLSEECP